MKLPPAWRKRWWWWALPLAFSALNVVFLWAHEEASGSGSRQLEGQLGRQAETLEEHRDERRRVEQMVRVAQQNELGMTELYEQRLSTQAERLTEVINEVRRLARLVGFDPTRISYSEDDFEQFGLVQESIVFRVSGTYPALRQLVNLLEISELFLILDEVRLRDLDGSRLDIELTISTLFSRPPAPAKAAS